MGDASRPNYYAILAHPATSNKLSKPEIERFFAINIRLVAPRRRGLIALGGVDDPSVRKAVGFHAPRHECGSVKQDVANDSRIADRGEYAVGVPESKEEKLELGYRPIVDQFARHELK